MVLSQPITDSLGVSIPAPAGSDSLSDLLRSFARAPDEIPQSLWDAALVEPVREFLSRPGKQFRGRLVELSWRLGRKKNPVAPALPLVVELLHAGSLIVDDIQDGSRQRRGRAALHLVTGVPLALNTGNWLYFMPLTLIADLHLPPALEIRIHRGAVETIRKCHEGQALDLAAKLGDLHPDEIRGVVEKISRWKTGSLMRLAATIGSLAAEAEPEVVGALGDFGERLGVGLQMQNDLSELLGAAGPLKYAEDLIQGRVTWPWALAAERLPAPQFDALQMRGAKLAGGNGDAATVARELVSALGPDPLAPVRDWLYSSFADLAAAVPAHPVVNELKAEIERLISL